MIVCEFNVSHVGNDSKAVQDAAAAKVLGGRSPDCARRVLPRDSEGEVGHGAGAARDGVLAPFGELLGALGDPGVEAGPDRADGSRGNPTKGFRCSEYVLASYLSVSAASRAAAMNATALLITSSTVWDDAVFPAKNLESISVVLQAL